MVVYVKVCKCVAFIIPLDSRSPLDSWKNIQFEYTTQSSALS